MIATGFLAQAKRFGTLKLEDIAPDHRGQPEHDRPGRARPVAPLRPLPRPQVRPDHGARLLRPLRLLRRHEVPVRRGGGGPPAERIRAAGPARPASRTTRRSTPRRSPGSRRSSPRPRPAGRPRERVRDLAFKAAVAEFVAEASGSNERAPRRSPLAKVELAKATRRRDGQLKQLRGEIERLEKAGPMAAGPAGLRRPRRRSRPTRSSRSAATRASSATWCPAACRRSSSPTAPSTCPPTGSGRLALARWLTEGPPRAPDGAGDGQPDLAAPLRQADRADALGLRPPRHAADPPRAARMAGRRLPRLGLVDQGDAPADHALGDLPARLRARLGGRRDRHRQRLVLAVRPPPARRRGPARQPARPGRQPQARPARPAPVPGRRRPGRSPRTTSSRRSTRRSTGAST